MSHAAKRASQCGLSVTPQRFSFILFWMVKVSSESTEHDPSSREGVEDPVSILLGPLHPSVKTFASLSTS